MAINTGPTYNKYVKTGHTPYDNFINKYGIRSINVNRSYDKFNYSGGTASYYNDREEIFDIEMDRRTFDYIVSMDEEHDRMWQVQREEMFLRNEHPAIKEAYDKYRMLLELYK